MYVRPSVHDILLQLHLFLPPLSHATSPTHGHGGHTHVADLPISIWSSSGSSSWGRCKRHRLQQPPKLEHFVPHRDRRHIFKHYQTFLRVANPSWNTTANNFHNNLCFSFFFFSAEEDCGVDYNMICSSLNLLYLSYCWINFELLCPRSSKVSDSSSLSGIRYGMIEPSHQMT